MKVDRIEVLVFIDDGTLYGDIVDINIKLNDQSPEVITATLDELHARLQAVADSMPDKTNS
jgi:hypothetical protein